ncbi:hypothetical protein C5167_047730, partial [Papaver somniferum]
KPQPVVNLLLNLQNLQREEISSRHCRERERERERLCPKGFSFLLLQLRISVLWKAHEWRGERLEIRVSIPRF